VSAGYVGAIGSVFALASVPALLILLWAYLSDVVPVMGTRREGYLMLASVLMAASWVTIAIRHEHYGIWLAVSAPLGLAAATSRAAIAGALAEIGRRRAATGRLAAAYTGLNELAGLAGQPMMLLTFTSLTFIAGLAAGLALSLVLLIVTLSLSDDRSPAPPLATEARVTIPRFLRSRTFWVLVLLFACAGFATVPKAVLDLSLHAAHDTGDHSWQADIQTRQMHRWMTGAVSIAVAIGYALLCRRTRLRNILRLTFVVQALVLAACGRMLQRGDTSFDVAFVARAAGDSLVTISLFDLALRAAPPGREAFGVILLVSFRTVLSSVIWPPLMMMLNASVTAVAWAAASAAIVAALVVSLVPRAIVEAREGEARPVIGSPP
jgi:hypothetical protein